MEAQVYITGYAGTEVETRGNGTVSAFRLACTPRIKTKGGWGDGNTTWIEVSCFRTLAQHVAQSVRKGRSGGGCWQVTDQRVGEGRPKSRAACPRGRHGWS